MKINSKLGIEILKLSIPSIISILLTNASGIIDLLFVSNLSKTNQTILGHIFPFQALIQAIGYLIGHGGGIIYCKKNNNKRIGKIIIILGLIIGIIYFFIGLIISILIESIIYKYYFIIISFSSIFLVLELAINNILRFNKSVIVPMIILLIGFILNFIFDYLFIIKFNLDILGNSLSYLLSHFFIFILLISFYLFKTRNNNDCIIKISYKDIIKLGFPSFLYQGLTSLSLFIISFLCKKYGEEYSILINICNRIYYLLLAIPYGIGQGVMPLVIKKQRGIYVLSIIYILFFLLIEIPIIALSSNIISYFINYNEIYQKIFIIFLLAIPFISITILTNLFLQSESKLFIANILAILRTGGIFIPLVLILNIFVNENCIYLARIISDLFVLILSIIISIR